MPLDPEKAAELREWLAKAEEDLRVAARLLFEGEPIIAAALFHCQQAVEKSLKGFLFWRGVHFPKTHDIQILAKSCSREDELIASVSAEAEFLTIFAWRFRYPGEASLPPINEARGALMKATEVYRAVLSRLPAEVNPANK